MLALDEFRLDHPALRGDRYAYFERCRATSSMHRRTVSLGDGRSIERIFLLNYADVRAMLTHEAARRRPPGATMPTTGTAGFVLNWVVFRDPPEHEALRSLLQPAFSPQRLRALEGRIRHWIDHRLAKLPGTIDVVAEITGPLPLLVLCDLAGLPADDWPRLRDWSERMTPLLLLETAAPDTFDTEMLVYFEDALERNRGADTLMGAMAKAVSEGALSREDAIANVAFLAWAGHETTARLMGNMVSLLLERPDVLARLRREPALVGAAVDEALRLEPPVQFTSRWATADISVDSGVIPAGSMVTAVLAAANRDPARFADPATFDLDRESQFLASFGFGPHYCLGDRLGRLESHLLLQQLLERFPDWQSVEGGTQWDEAVAMHGLKSLSATFS